MWTSKLPLILALLPHVIQAASSWDFRDATVSTQTKGTGVGGGQKEGLKSSAALTQPISLASSGTLKIILTTVENGTPKRPHQVFLSLQEADAGLDTSYAFNVKENGKAKLELTAKDLPVQFWDSPRPLLASLIIASFGSSKPYRGHIFNLDITVDSSHPVAKAEKPLRYGKLEEIHHTFRPDPKSPRKIVTLIFTAAILAAFPILLGSWISLGANLNHLPQALRSSPLAYIVFCSSIIALEGIFFLYYTRWNLFQTLPAAAAVGSVAFLSGTRALSEVQERRLAGQR